MAVDDFAIRGNRVVQVTSGAKVMTVETNRPDVRIGMTFTTDTYSSTPTPTFFDDFNRPDGDVGNGWASTYGTPTLKIVNNQFSHAGGTAGAGTGNGAIGRSLAKNFDITFDFTRKPASSGASRLYFYFRTASTAGDGYELVADHIETILNQRSGAGGGTKTRLATAAPAPNPSGLQSDSVNGRWRVVANGSYFAAYFNGTLVLGDAGNTLLGADVVAATNTYGSIDLLNVDGGMTLDNFSAVY